MRALQQRAVEIAERARRERVRDAAARIRELLPDAEVEERGSAIHVAGPTLRRSWLFNPALRFLGRLPL